MNSRPTTIGMVVITLAAALGGCVAIDEGGDQSIPVTKAVLPTTVQPYRRIDETLYCVRQTGVLRGRTFVVGPFADSTGKINAVAPGSTGNFMPQGGSAAYITDALAKAGARVVSTYFGAPKESVPAQYAINGIFNSLDFDTPLQADFRINGIGPTAQAGFAQLSLTIQLDEVGTRLNRQMSMIQRPVRYVQLGVADVIMKEFPRAWKRCGGIVADLLMLATAEPDGQWLAAGAQLAEKAPVGPQLAEKAMPQH